MLRRIVASVAIALALAGPVHADARIKDITVVQGIRDNQLVGYGLVIGLAGTGDSLRGAPFTDISMRSMLQRMGVGLGDLTLQSKNVAAVVTTATLPPFVSQGARLDVTVSSLGDATSLSGGTLVMTPLVAANGDTYAVAQGSVTVNGFSANGQAASVTKGVPTTGRVPNGAIVERDNGADINSIPHLTLELQNPDFGTAAKIADKINAYARKKFGKKIASELDFRSVRVIRPETIPASRLLAEIGLLRVDADVPARIVIDERNGTIVMGENVRISPVAVSHGSITIKITEDPAVSQPNPFSDGKTVVVPSTTIDVSQEGGQVAVLQGPTLESLVRGLNSMGLKPPEITSILQTIKSAGALQAELVVQ
ncbi:MAG: flagellar basal body P-ring protein FlgI [Proteobacteria bacterium]|nr:flagellar basal body P-ring protein FlgI [Pseudomonadota bacterium]